MQPNGSCSDAFECSCAFPSQYLVVNLSHCQRRGQLLGLSTCFLFSSPQCLSLLLVDAQLPPQGLKLCLVCCRSLHGTCAVTAGSIVALLQLLLQLCLNLMGSLKGSLEGAHARGMLPFLADVLSAKVIDEAADMCKVSLDHGNCTHAQTVCRQI